MPYKNIFNYVFVNAQSMASSFESDVIDLSNVQGFSVQADYTGSPVGTLKLMVSDNGSKFYDYPNSSVSIPTTDGGQLYIVSQVHFDKVKLVYTASSGSGNLTAQINAKGDDDA